VAYFAQQYFVPGTKNYRNRTTIVEIIVGGWVVSFFETQCRLVRWAARFPLPVGIYIYSGDPIVVKKNYIYLHPSPQKIPFPSLFCPCLYSSRVAVVSADETVCQHSSESVNR